MRDHPAVPIAPFGVGIGIGIGIDIDLGQELMPGSV
jgi:hypothetical protein